ncbi:hypothetical protein Golob_024321, partial [Gossypium lobatum]|nr:hypothetical protein [Gossypium lobatum]
MEGILGEPVCRIPLKDNERKVKDLWDNRNGRWKRERVKEIYGEYLENCICNLTIPHNGVKDTRLWLQNPHGIYITKSAYLWMILKKVGFGPHRFLWRAIWKLKMIPKIKIFSWRISHNILPTYDNIARIRQGVNNACPSWNDKNNMAFKRKIDATEMIWERAQTLSKDFRIFNLTEPTVFSNNPVNKNWKKPPVGSIKVIVDATILNGYRGVGVVARDHDGFVIGGCYNCEEKAMDVIWAELDAFKE